MLSKCWQALNERLPPIPGSEGGKLLGDLLVVESEVKLTQVQRSVRDIKDGINVDVIVASGNEREA